MSLLSAAVALALGSLAADASAVALGRLNVMSALGQPLRAEIEITDLAPGDADGLRVSIASADAFNAAGVPYNAVLSDVKVGVTRRPDGRYVVRLTSNRSLSEPFVDLLLEANWASGRIVRDYTVLLDPPGTRLAQAPVAPVAPQISPVERPAPVRRERAPVVAAAPAPAPAASAASVAGGDNPRSGGAGGEQVRVQPGDTASKIAGTYKPADVSLDQMLVALLRANPDAFIGGNVNRMRAGAVIQVPSAAQAEAVPAPEAHRTVSAQSADFGDYRRRLADNVQTSKVPEADRQASGKLQANVQDRNAASAAADKLKISQGIAPGRPSDEQIAQSRQAQAANERVAELSKNISDLNKLQAASGTAPAAGATPAGASAATAAAPAAAATSTAPAAAAPAPVTAPTVSASAPAAAASSAPPASATPAAAAASSTPAAPATAASAPAATPGAAAPAAAGATPAVTAAAPAPASEAAAKPPAAPKPKVAAAPPPPPQSFFSDLLDNPLMLGLAALIVAAIAFLLYRVLGRKRQDAGDSVFIESRIPKDSFFGASGGESVDTKNRSTGMSSLSYSPSQLDAGDVDPVAEADVYLAYGRDLQAEEILREALRVNPERSAIHLKLLEIHAKRRDLRGYEALAAEVHKLTGGTGSEWNRVVEMGKELDPGNPLYETGKGNVTAAEAAAFAGTLAAASAATAAANANVHATPHAAAAPLLPVTPAAAAPAPIAPGPIAAAAPPAFVPSVAPLDFDLDLTRPASLPDTLPAPVSASLPLMPSEHDSGFAATAHDGPRVLPAAVAPLNGNMATAPAVGRLDLDNDFETAPGALEPITRPGPVDEERTQPAPLGGLHQDSGFIEFDMSSLAGLGARAPSDTERGRLEPLDDSGENPHVIKLSLARELKALGDVEGARSLVEEVAAESAGDIKAEAKQLLGQLR